MIIEKIPSPKCEECGSTCVFVTENGIECSDCSRITANTSDLLLERKEKVERLLTERENFNETL